MGPLGVGGFNLPLLQCRDDFPSSQSDKVRPIDDFSQSQVNSTVTSHEQATVDGPDVICSLALYLMKVFAEVWQIHGAPW